jgi:hypothetical protein
MSFFPLAVAALLEERIVRWPLLVEFDFDTPKYLWNGYRKLVAGGKTWEPVKGHCQVNGLGESSGTTSSQITVSVSGALVTDSMVQKAITADRAAYVNKLLKIWVVPLDDFWQPTMDGPFCLSTGIMTALPISEIMNDDRTVTRTLTIEAENIFYGRSGVPNSYRSDLDQKNRFAGDRGMEFITSLQNATVTIPW